MPTISDFYGPIAAGQAFGAVTPQTLTAVSGGIPGPDNAAMTWVILLLLLVAFRVAWEFSPMAKE